MITHLIHRHRLMLISSSNILLLDVSEEEEPEEKGNWQVPFNELPAINRAANVDLY